MKFLLSKCFSVHLLLIQIRASFVFSSFTFLCVSPSPFIFLTCHKCFVLGKRQLSTHLGLSKNPDINQRWCFHALSFFFLLSFFQVLASHPHETIHIVFLCGMSPYNYQLRICFSGIFLHLQSWNDAIIWIACFCLINKKINIYIYII